MLIGGSETGEAGLRGRDRRGAGAAPAAAARAARAQVREALPDVQRHPHADGGLLAEGRRVPRAHRRVHAL